MNVLESKVVSTGKMDSVQLLRAIAALSVVMHHIPIFGNGEWGVDIFFIISGFIMCFVTQGSCDHFFTKRVIRIVPLYWLGTFSVFCVALTFPHFLNKTTANPINLFKSLAFIPYLKGNSVQPMLYLGWSLNYEMFFYLVFALSIAINHTYRWIICSAILLLLIIIGKAFPFESVILKFYTSSILIEFILGMFSYKLYSLSTTWRLEKVTQNERIWLSIGALVLLMAMPCATTLVPTLGRSITWGLPASILFLFTVHSLSNKQLPRIVVLIGDASFSLYLFHPFIIQAFDKIFYAFASPNTMAYIMAMFAIAICCLVSAIIYRFVELPVTIFLRSIFTVQ